MSFLAIYTIIALMTATVLAENLSGIPYRTGSLQDAPFPKRIEYQTITVDDFPAAQKFYVGIMGAAKIDEFPVFYHGDQHFAALFPLPSEQLTAPNVRSDGDASVKSQFLLLGNAIIQLIQFVHRYCFTPYSLREMKTSPCFIGSSHIDFWIHDDVKMDNFIEAVEVKAYEAGLSNVQWNRPIPQETRDDRQHCPSNRYANKVTEEGPFEGLEWSYFKGPIAEQLELYRMTGTMKEHIGKAYCKRGAVSLAFVPQNRHRTVTSEQIARSVYGIFQHGFRTDDLHASVGFYTEVLGGNLIDYPVHGIDIRGDDAHWMILANETIAAYEYALQSGVTREAALEIFGVSNISTSGNHRLDHRFILFDNFVIEPLLYTAGLSFGGKPFSPKWNHTTSPAYIGTITAAFGTEEPGMTFAEFVSLLEARAVRHGFPSAVFPSTFADFPSSHPYSGLEYGLGKGPSGESLNYVKIGGNFRERLEIGMMKGGGVTTAFNSTDIYRNGNMTSYCARFHE